MTARQSRRKEARHPAAARQAARAACAGCFGAAWERRCVSSAHCLFLCESAAVCLSACLLCDLPVCHALEALHPACSRLFPFRPPELNVDHFRCHQSPLPLSWMLPSQSASSINPPSLSASALLRPSAVLLRGKDTSLISPSNSCLTFSAQSDPLTATHSSSVARPVRTGVVMRASPLPDSTRRPSWTRLLLLQRSPSSRPPPYLILPLQTQPAPMLPSREAPSIPLMPLLRPRHILSHA